MQSSLKRSALIAASFALAIALLGGGVYALVRPKQTPEVSASLSLSEALIANDPNFKKVTAPRQFVFPEDHGPHPEYALEWWYYTGNLNTTSGRHFGYQLTFFRIGLTTSKTQRASNWAAQHMYSAHLALTDVQNDKFYSFERYSRAALGLAGASSAPFRVWTEDWNASSGTENTLPMRLYAKDQAIEIDLTLNSAKNIVLHGEDGFSRKGNNHGEASYYYSLTRMPTKGTVTLSGESYSVSGTSWLDREWSSTQLSAEHIGWDWFALQLSDGNDIMYGILRPRAIDGSPFILGTIVAPDGTYTRIQPKQVQLDALEKWTSPRGGSYPSRWRFKIPAQDLDIHITPYINDQELDTVVRYWEGAVQIEGTSKGRPITGSGYVELTGYAE